MKKLIYTLITFCCIVLAGCFETTQEITLNQDGTGVLINTNDMSSMVAMMRQFGGEEVDKIPNMDSTLIFANMVDSMKNLTQQEKNLIRKGTMSIVVNIKDEKMVAKFNLPFQKMEDVKSLKEILPKITQLAVTTIAGENEKIPNLTGEDEKPAMKIFDDYFDFTMTKNLVTNTLNANKYATVADDKYMKSLQQMSGMGAPLTVNYVINLPRPAIKAEGKGIKLSDDKKKVTLSVTSDDFFDEPAKFEYRIEY